MFFKKIRRLLSIASIGAVMGGCAAVLDVRIDLHPYTAPDVSESLWVDADFACAEQAVFADPDDCLAMVLLERAGAQIVGVSTTHGNGSAELAHRIGRQTVQPNVPVWRGDRACDSPFVSAIGRELRAQPMTVVAFGPLTNVATLIRCDPAAARRITEVVFVGGRRPGSRLVVNQSWLIRPELRDLNVEVDPESVEQVLRSGVRLRLVPFEAGRSVPLGVFTPEFRAATLPPGLSASLERWSVLTSVAWGSHGVLPFDPVAASAILWPQIFRCEAVNLHLQGGRLHAVGAGVDGRHQYCLPKEPAVVQRYLMRLLHNR